MLDAEADRLYGEEAVIVWPQGVAPESDMTASTSRKSTVDLGSRGPVGRSATELRFLHLATVFGLIP